MSKKTGQEYLDQLIARGEAVVCHRASDVSEYDRIIARQEEMETGSQVVGEDDEWA